MKLWQAILFSIAILVVLSLLVAFLLPTSEVFDKLISSLFLLISAIWVYKDAKKLNTEKYKSNLGMHPGSLAIWTFILWIVFFPGYLWLRYRIKNNLVPIREKYKTQS